MVECDCVVCHKLQIATHDDFEISNSLASFLTNNHTIIISGMHMCAIESKFNYGFTQLPIAPNQHVFNSHSKKGMDVSRKTPKYQQREVRARH